MIPEMSPICPNQISNTVNALSLKMALRLKNLILETSKSQKVVNGTKSQIDFRDLVPSSRHYMSQNAVNVVNGSL